MASSNNYHILVKAILDESNLQGQINKAASKIKNVKIGDAGTKTATSGFNKMNQAIDKTSQSMSDIIKKTVKWQAGTQAIDAIYNSFRSGVSAVFELDAAMTELRKVSDLTGDELTEFGDKALKVGERVARTATQVIEAATEFTKSGFNDIESLQLAEVASMFQNVADEEVNAGDAASFLISQMKAFNITAEESEHIVDAVNEVANKFAVSSGDLATAVPKVAATMAQAGNSMEQTLGLLTAGAEMMPGQASRVARGLRSITLNLQAMDDSGQQDLELLASMEKDFNKIGITLQGTDGQLKSTFDILSELAEVWDTLDQNTKNYYASLIGGKTQVDVVNSVISNFDSALGATEAGMNSFGSAARENAAYLDSIEGRMSALTAQFQRFFTEGISSDSVKNVLGLATAILEVVNSIGGLQTFLPIIISFATIFIGKQFPNGVNNLKNSFTNLLQPLKDLPTAISLAIGEFTRLKSSGVSSFSALAGSASSFFSLIGPGAIIGIGATLFSVINGVINAQEEAHEQMIQDAEQKNSELKSQRESLEKEIASYQELAEKRNDSSSDTERLKYNEEIAQVQENIVDLVGAEANGLDLVNGNLDEQLSKLGSLHEILTDNQKLQLELLMQDAETDYNESLGSMEQFYDEIATITGKTEEDIRSAFESGSDEIYDYISQTNKELQRQAKENDNFYLANNFANMSQDFLTKQEAYYDYQNQLLEASTYEQEQILSDFINERDDLFANGEIDSKESLMKLVEAIKDGTLDVGEAALEAGVDVNTYRQRLLELVEEKYGAKFANSISELRTVINAEGEEITAAATGFAKKIEEALKIEPETASLETSIEGYQKLLKNVSSGNWGVQTQELMSLFFGEDWVQQFDGDLEAAGKHVKEKWGSFFQYFQDGNFGNFADIIKNSGIDATLASVGADGSLNIDFSRLDELAAKLGVSKEMLTTIMKAYEQTGGVINYELDDMIARAEQLGLITETASGNFISLGANAQEALGMTDLQFANFKKQLQEAGYQILDLNSSTDEWLSVLEGSHIVEVVGDAKIGDLPSLVAYLKDLGFTDSQIHEVVNKLQLQAGVTFNADGSETTPEQVQSEIDKLDQEEATVYVLMDTNADEEGAKVQDFADKTNAIPSQQTKTVTFVANLQNNTPLSSSELFSNWKKDPSSVSLGQHWTGTAPSGVPKNELSWLGEKGPELVTDKKGKNAYIAGLNGAELGYLRKGDVVYNAKDTRDILSGVGNVEGLGDIDENWSAPSVPKKNTNTGTTSTKKTSSSSSNNNSSSDSDAEREQEEALRRQKENFEDALDYIQDLADKEIEALEEQKKEEQEYWDAKIEALQKQNEELDKQLELEEALENLAKAQNTRVRIYREGQGFVYESDMAAVNEAQKELDDIKREQAYEEELENLENQKEAAEEAIDAQIQYWEDYKELWEDAANSYENNQNRLIAEQLFGLNQEQENWEKRLGNLQSFVDQYNAILQQLDDNYISPGSSGSSVGTGKVSSFSGTLKSGSRGDAVKALQNALNSLGYGNLAVDGIMGSKTVAALKRFQKDSGISADGIVGTNTRNAFAAKGFASGSSYIPRNMIGRINEDGSELYIPPEQNILAPLSKGAGIVPHTLAQNLMEIGKYHPSQLLNASAVSNKDSISKNNYFNFDKLVLPNVTNAESFVSTLKNNFMSTAIQVGSFR